MGAVKAPEPVAETPKEPRAPPSIAADAEISAGESDTEEASPAKDSDAENTPAKKNNRNRKRKRIAENEDIEGKYLATLAPDHEEAVLEREPKKSKAEGAEDVDSEDDSDSDDDEPAAPAAGDPSFPIKHESLVDAAAEKRKAELSKSARTVFLGNVPSNAISSKTDYKTLKAFFATAGKIKSVRFRSVAFSEQIPRKAAFVNHKLHEKQKTVNAYIVYADEAGAREAMKLNGSVVLARHIRVDSVAHPAKQDHRRCIFVGNLDFESQEESLWKHFLAVGKVEYVRVVRDAKTNVGKGFAYVQFEDPMCVDPALLLDGVKMAGDRKLRITRAKAIKRKDAARKTAERKPAARSGRVYVPKADPKEQANLGRATKLLGRAGAAQLKSQSAVFEGHRASSKDDAGVNKGGSGRKKGKPRARAQARSGAWKKGAVPGRAPKSD